MGLHILSSTRFDALTQDLKGRVLASRNSLDAFRSLSIVVPNPNVGKYLQMRVFAFESSLVANLRFPFMEESLTRLLRPSLDNSHGFELLPPHSYARAIAGMLVGAYGEDDELLVFRNYVMGGAGEVCGGHSGVEARKLWGLADKLAILMDQYEVRRPEIVKRWMGGENAAGTGGCACGSIEAGEAAIARRLWGEGGIFPTSGTRLSLRQLFERVERRMPEGPRQTLFFFGHSTLNILQARILVWLARVHDVYFYHNNVCLEYWGDIETKEERVARLGKAHDLEEDIEVENALLRSWGKAGRETMRLLVDLEEELGSGEVEFEWQTLVGEAARGKKTVLGLLHESIERRTSEIQKVPQDASVQIVGAPGVRREVEMVYNAILGSVWKAPGSGTRPWGACSFSDVAVLVPDMKTYRPVIEAVFDGRGQIPYGLIDTTVREESLYLAGFEALVELGRKGLGRGSLFAILENPCVQAALDFAAEDVVAWKELTCEMGVFDAYEQAEEAEGSRFNWAWGLERLRLAQVASELENVGVDGGELPLDLASDGRALKFSEVVEFVWRRVEEVFTQEELTCGDWSARFVGLMASCLSVAGGDDELEGAVRLQIIETLAGLEGIEGVHGYEFVVAAVGQFVGGAACRRGGYLTHGVTIAGLLPMRPVPFREVYILGMGAGGFPGQQQESTLDVRALDWRLGDTSAANINRYLFLETVMAVRERLVISYPNRDVAKVAQLYPSGMVRELEDFLTRHILKGVFCEIKDIPLLERAARAVEDVKWAEDDPFAGLVETYSEVARRMACERLGSVQGEGAVGKLDASNMPREERVEISARELAAFLKSPLNACLEWRLGIAREAWREDELQEESPLWVDKLQEWRLRKEWLRGEDEMEKAFRDLRLRGGMPGGFIGDAAKGKIREKLAACACLVERVREKFGAVEDVSRQNFVWGLDVCGRRVRVRFTAEVENWIESVEGIEVLCLGKLEKEGARDRKPKNVLPQGCVLEALMACVMAVANGTSEGVRRIVIWALDVDVATMVKWEWCLTRGAAEDYLTRLVEWMLTYLDAAKDGTYLDCSYDEVRAYAGKTAYEAPQRNSRALVVEQSIEALRRAPTAAELEALVKGVYGLPLAGVKEVGA